MYPAQGWPQIVKQQETAAHLACAAEKIVWTGGGHDYEIHRLRLYSGHFKGFL
jgi:hypothetical protein